MTTWIYLFCFITIAALLGAAGRAYVTHEERMAIEQAGRELQRIAELKAQDLARWREMRLNMAETLASNPVLHHWLETLCREPSNTVAQAEARVWMEQLREHYGFRDILLLDATQQTCAALAEGDVHVGSNARALLAEADRSGQPQLSDFHTNVNVPEPHLDLAIPFHMRTRGASSPPTTYASLLMRIDPERYLYPMLRRWPVPSASGEVLLIRREGEALLYLNRPRLHPVAPLTMLPTLTQTNLPEVQAALGQRGVVAGTDYRGLPVLAVLHAVPETPWLLIAKRDCTEVLQNLATTRKSSLLATTSAIGAVGLLLALLALLGRLHVLRNKQEIELEFQQLFDRVGDAILLFQNGRFIMANEAAGTQYGYTHDELMRLTPQDLAATEAAPDKSDWNHILRHHDPAIFETVHRRRDNSRLPVEIGLRSTTYRGQPAIISDIRDITRRRQLAEQLQVAYEKSVGLEAAINRSPVVVVLRRDGLDSPLEYISENVRRWGYRAEELIGQTALPWIHPDDLPGIAKETRQYIARHLYEFMLSYRLLTHEGDVRWVEDHTRLLCNTAGVIKQVQSLLIDVTAHRELAQELQQVQKMETIGRLAGGIAHDFNNLLQVILGFAELLAADLPANDLHRRDVREIQTAAQRAKDLTSRLLAFSRKQMIQPTVTDLNALITAEQTMLARVLGKTINLHADLAENLWLTKVDQNQMQQILLNLTVNARDAMRAGGRFVLATQNVTFEADDVAQHAETRAGDFVCLAISDTGTGMTADIITHLFEPFFTTKATGQGTGLGLAMAYGIMKQHDGWIHVYSQLGHGTTFKLYLPAVTAKKKAAAPASAASPAPPTNQRLLLVEDEDSVRNLASRILRARGYQVTATRNLAEAKIAWENEAGQFDLIFSAVVLPDGNGLELVENLLQRQPTLRIIMASGYTDERSRWSTIQARGFRFLPKPYPVATLLRTIQEIFAAPPPA
ncbi:MAG: PAS domain S-box protein [Verrucomicrobia bacterium]|nr:MAG: PAS domain S-box protein [Verrucomicrobiota bacterium]